MEAELRAEFSRVEPALTKHNVLNFGLIVGWGVGEPIISPAAASDTFFSLLELELSFTYLFHVVFNLFWECV